MSRSYKKNIWQIRGPLYGIHNRVFRRVNKQRVREGKEPVPPRTLINDYNITDWKFISQGKKPK